jgi:O-antigen ligase
MDLRASLKNIFEQSTQGQLILTGWSLLVVGSILLAVTTEVYLLAGLPLFALLIYVTLVDFKAIYFLLLASIPISTEYYLPGGLGTTLPTEPLMVGLMLVLVLWGIRHARELRLDALLHPLTLLLLVHLTWVYLTVLTSDLIWVSAKFALSKTWYIFAFYFFSIITLKTVKDFKKAFWFIFIPLFLTILITLVRHAAIGFSFEMVHTVFYPFHRNHVNYSALLSLFFPILILAIGWYAPYSRRWWLLIVAAIIFLAGIYFAYTRAGYIALMIAAGAYVIIRLRWMKMVILASFVAGVVGVAYLANDNKYLEYAPNFDRTISHTEFDNLLEATYKGEDISTMERVYRWVAGFNMITDKPVTGVGPGNFVNFYKSYTVTSFKTYVSDNEDLSGIHSYYLMTAVEQGLVGLLIFLILCAAQLIIGERIYHQTKDPLRRSLVLAALLCLVVIDAFQIINDMLETDKMGPFFFITTAVLVNMDRLNCRSEQSEAKDDSQ